MKMLEIQRCHLNFSRLDTWCVEGIHEPKIGLTPHVRALYSELGCGEITGLSILCKILGVPKR